MDVLKEGGFQKITLKPVFVLSPRRVDFRVRKSSAPLRRKV